MPLNLFISAGDVSGDIHAANLVRSIKKIYPESFVSSMGGPRLKDVSDEFLENLVSLSAFGFWEPVKLYFRLKKIFNEKIIRGWKKKRPDKVILIDYYGFNIHIARRAYSEKIPVYYYIAPQLWATRPGRIKKMSRYVDKVLLILPFEEEIYRQAGMDVTFVGHPLLDIVPEPLDPGPLNEAKPIIGLFPGSRPSVFRRHLPILLEAAEIIKKTIPADFRIFGLSSFSGEFSNSPFPVVAENNFSERQKLALAITTSGTVSLENALLGIPMVVFYRLSRFNYALARRLVRIPYITMANILAGKQLVPELIQDRARPAIIAENALKFLRDKDYYCETKRQLLELRNQLGKPGAGERAAKIIIDG